MAATRRAYTGAAVSTTTASSIAASGTTSFTITAYTGWPYGTDPFYVVVEPGTASEEKILVTRTGSTDTTINVASDSERGQDGTSAVSHNTGSTVFPVFTSVDADEANAVASIITADTTNTRIGINDSTPSYTLDVTGDINATGDLRIGGTAIGKWQTWTPTFGNVSAQPTVTAAYAEVNGIVFWACYFDMNGASITGSLHMSAPVEPADRYSADRFPNGYGWVRPTGSGSFYTGTSIALGGGLDDIYFYTPSIISSIYISASDNIDATTPISWTGSGYGWFTGWYEAK